MCISAETLIKKSRWFVIVARDQQLFTIWKLEMSKWCHWLPMVTADGVSVLGESLQRQRPFSLELAVVSVSIC